ncbi:MAG TPA: hypothetical protein VK210_02240 [Terriglobia bacterium]|nr:hypothetical protein [Terriglobia bacterium]
MRMTLRKILKIAALLCAATSIHATTLARLSLDQLAAAADATARVRCSSAQSRWENGQIWTVTSFDVLETMKGTLPARITVRLPGGRVGHFTAIVDGTPKFNAAEEVVVFLERIPGGLKVEPAPGGGFSVAAWVEGTFRIRRDPRTGIETVTQDSSNFAVFDTATRTFHTEGIRRMPMQQFRERVATALTRAQEKSR